MLLSTLDKTQDVSPVRGCAEVTENPFESPTLRENYPQKENKLLAKTKKYQYAQLVFFNKKQPFFIEKK
jgi:hypothetical protein